MGSVENVKESVTRLFVGHKGSDDKPFKGTDFHNIFLQYNDILYQLL